MGSFLQFRRTPAFAISLILTGLQPLNAEVDEQIAAYSLEQLLNIEVSVASFKPQEITEAPLIVSRYSRNTLEKMGVNSLPEMLSFVPGLVLQQTQSNNTAIMSRGLVDAFNQKVLFLIDGVPYWAPSHSAIPLQGIPFAAIDHIEVVRGPGAVYYGTNASAAVINIVTLDKGNSSIALQLTEKRNNVQGFLHQGDSDAWFSLSMEKQSDQGQPGEIINLSPDFGLVNSGELIESVDKQSILLRGGYGDLDFMAQSFENIANDFSEPVDNILTEGLRYRGSLVHVNYTSQIGGSDFKIYSDYNQFGLKFPIRNSLVSSGIDGDGGFRFDDESNNYRWRLGASANTQINENYSLLWGYEQEHRRTSEYQVFNQADNSTVNPIMLANHVDERAIFIQNDIHWNNWRFLLGGRHVEVEDKKHLSPQVSLVYRLDTKQSLKLLFAEGFNSPNFVQRGINFGPALQGNPDLVSEKIQTLDLAYNYSQGNQLFVANMFYVEANDLIQRDVSTGIIQFANTGSTKRSGVELDYQWVGEIMTAFANLSYLKQGRSLSEDPAAFVAPKWMVSVGFHYSLNDNQSIGSSANYVSKRASASDYIKWDISYQYQWDQLTLYTGIENLLDETIVSSDVQNFTVDQEITNRGGREWMLGAKYEFH